MFSLTRSLKVGYVLGLAAGIILLSRPAPTPAQFTLKAPVAPMLSQITQGFWMPQVQQNRMMLMSSGMGMGGMGMMGMGGMMGMMGMRGGMMGMGGGMMGMMGMGGGMMMGGMSMMGMGGMGMGGMGMGGMGMRGGMMGGFAGKGMGGFNGRKPL